jgi:hypothetical protein
MIIEKQNTIIIQKDWECFNILYIPLIDTRILYIAKTIAVSTISHSSFIMRKKTFSPLRRVEKTDSVLRLVQACAGTIY